MAVLWNTSAAAPQSLGTLAAGGTSRAYAISGDGLVVGEATNGSGGDRGALWAVSAQNVVSGPLALEPLAGDVRSVALGVDGVVVESEAADGSVRAVAWALSGGTPGAAVALGGGRSASGIHGQRVVGEFGAPGQAALWDLRATNGNLVESVNTAPSQGYGINGLGQIVGRSGNGAFLALPQ